MTVYMSDTDYKAICDATREKTGATGLLKSYEIKPLLAALETDGAKFYLTVNVDSGSTVTATKGSLSVSGTAANGKAVLTLPEAGEWTVTSTLNGQSANAVVNVVGEYAAEVSTVSIDPVFANNDWATIIEVCKKREVPDTWVVGDQKAMTIGGTSYLFDIIGKDHDAYADGSGYAPITLQMHDCYAETYRMNSTNTNVGGWRECEMRKITIPSLLALMPSEVQAGVREVNKTTYVPGAGAYDVTADKLFLLSENEFFGKTTSSGGNEGIRYAYYSAGNGVRKSVNGSYVQHWERSPYGSRTHRFCTVASGGTAYYTDADRLFYVAPAFCF